MAAGIFGVEMQTKLKWVIPKPIMIAAVNQVMENRTGYCCDKWGEQEASECRAICGDQYQYIETDWVRRAAIALRKNGLLKSVNGGPKRRKLVEPSGKYLAYLNSEHWTRFRLEVLAFWGGKCALCASKAKDVHHNTYVRVESETITDVVPLCRRCHKRFHGVMPDGNEQMNGGSDGLF
jgi:5-methylcytosine-specific restriction endonuclease McrA